MALSNNETFARLLRLQTARLAVWAGERGFVDPTEAGGWLSNRAIIRLMDGHLSLEYSLTMGQLWFMDLDACRYDANVMWSHYRGPEVPPGSPILVRRKIWHATIAPKNVSYDERETVCELNLRLDSAEKAMDFIIGRFRGGKMFTDPERWARVSEW